MKKVLISIKNDSIIFSYKIPPKTDINLLNTNIISDNELLFSEDYIESNIKIVSLFVKELCQEKNLYRAIIDTNHLAVIVLDLFKKNPFITAINIKENCSLTYSVYEKIIENRNINYVEASSIQQFMLELLDKRNIHGESRAEVLYLSNFMINNNLTNFSKIFYKMNIRISDYLKPDDLDDLKAFLNINKYLKNIHLDVFNKSDLEVIVGLLLKYKIKNVKILIYDNIKDSKLIDYLKKLNKKLSNKRLRIELVYSKEYLKSAIFKQIIVNTVKACGVLILAMVVGTISYVGISNYVSLQEVSQIQEKVKQTIEEKKDEEIVIPNNRYEIKNNYIASLLSINNDVTGWLKVNNTNIDYPVVQGENNEYYLNYNLYHEQDINGWVFMDYRNSVYNLDTNTIIYAHNRYYSGVMFGSLYKAYNSSWYKNPENQIISFNTLYETNNYQIFSIYKTPKTIDYLKTYFADDEEYNNYIDMVRSRSVYDFGVNINTHDKILTLSTCTDNNQRLVVHAKLITE